MAVKKSTTTVFEEYEVTETVEYKNLERLFNVSQEIIDLQSRALEVQRKMLFNMKSK